MKSQWNGHALVTRRKLLSILERASAGSEQFSVAERALYTACEFWAAVESRTLRDFLGAAATEQLRYAGIVFRAIGAPDIADSVDAALAELSGSGAATGHGQCIATLQNRLLGSRDPIDDLIARFAQRVH